MLLVASPWFSPKPTSGSPHGVTEAFAQQDPLSGRPKQRGGRRGEGWRGAV